MNKELIKKAFEFYDINDKEYLDKCLETFDLINKDSNLKNRVLNLINTLYIKHEDNKFSDIINTSYEELFNTDNLYITNVIILLGVDIHSNNIKEFDKEIIEKHKFRVRDSLILYKDGMSIRQMTWLSHFLAGKIIEVGCLQYQIMDDYYMECNIKIHIPRNTNLSTECVKDSINKSKEYIKKYYGIDNPRYFCNSWMLGSTTKDSLNKDSNIYKFIELFDIKEEYESLDVLRFVFETKNNDYSKLEEKTSLQRSLKKMLLDGRKLYNGIGILK